MSSPLKAALCGIASQLRYGIVPLSIVSKVNSKNGWGTNRRAITAKCTLTQGYLLLHFICRCCYIVLPCHKYLCMLLLLFCTFCISCICFCDVCKINFLNVLCEGLRMEISSKLNLALLRLIHFNVLSVHYCALSLPNTQLNK